MKSRGVPATSMVKRPLAAGCDELHPALGTGAPIAAGAGPPGASTTGSAPPPMSPAGWRRSTFAGGASVATLEFGVGAPPVIASSAVGCVVVLVEGAAGVAGAVVFASGGSELSLEHAPTATTKPTESMQAFMRNHLASTRQDESSRRDCARADEIAVRS